jgi:hypothetical protein
MYGSVRDEEEKIRSWKFSEAFQQAIDRLLKNEKRAV